MSKAPDTADEAVLRALAAAEAALRGATGALLILAAPRRLSDPERRNLALRVTMRGGSGERTIIVKQSVPPPWEKPEAQAVSLDRLGPLFLDAVAAGRGHAPAVLASADRLIVLEDLGDGPTLVEPLLRGSAGEAEAALLALARRLGRLHADTVGLRARFDALQTSLWPGSELRIRRFFERVDTVLDSIEQRLPDVRFPREECAAVAAALADPGPFLAYTHGDPCPDNVFLVNGEARLIDFEHGRFGHALIDGVYVRMAFPTCWCAGRSPDDVVARCEAAYRAELARRVPPAADDAIYFRALTEAAAAWLIARLDWLLPSALDGPSLWGISDGRARLLNDLDVFAALAERSGALPAFRDFAGALRRDLERRWPETTPLALYPAFRAKAASGAPST